MSKVVESVCGRGRESVRQNKAGVVARFDKLYWSLLQPHMPRLYF